MTDKNKPTLVNFTGNGDKDRAKIEEIRRQWPLLKDQEKLSADVRFVQYQANIEASFTSEQSLAIVLTGMK